MKMPHLSLDHGLCAWYIEGLLVAYLAGRSHTAYSSATDRKCAAWYLV